MCFPPGWTKLKGMNDSDETDSPRYHALGNAVTPPVAEWIGERTLAYLRAADSVEIGDDELAASL